MSLTLEMIAFVQVMMMQFTVDSPTFARLERIETYLIDRYNREE